MTVCVNLLLPRQGNGDEPADITPTAQLGHNSSRSSRARGTNRGGGTRVPGFVVQVQMKSLVLTVPPAATAIASRLLAR